VNVLVIVVVVAAVAGSVVARRAKCGLAANLHDTDSSFSFSHPNDSAAPPSVPRSTPSPDLCYLRRLYSTMVCFPLFGNVHDDKRLDDRVRMKADNGSRHRQQQHHAAIEAGKQVRSLTTTTTAIATQVRDSEEEEAEQDGGPTAAPFAMLQAGAWITYDSPQKSKAKRRLELIVMLHRLTRRMWSTWPAHRRPSRHVKSFHR
jgi:hypothetical protein